MTKVKVFVYGRRRRHRRRRRRRGYDNSSPDFRHGELKTDNRRGQNVVVQERETTYVEVDMVTFVTQ